MWYFAWILGVGFAASFAIINAMWLESVCDIDTHGIDQSCDSLAKHDQAITYEQRTYRQNRRRQLYFVVIEFRRSSQPDFSIP